MADLNALRKRFKAEKKNRLKTRQLHNMIPDEDAEKVLTAADIIMSIQRHCLTVLLGTKGITAKQ